MKVHDIGKLGPPKASAEIRKAISDLFELSGLNPSKKIRDVISENPQTFPKEAKYYVDKINGEADLKGADRLDERAGIKRLWRLHKNWGAEWLTQVNSISPIINEIAVEHHSPLDEADPMIKIIDFYEASTSRPRFANGKTNPPLTHEEAISALKNFVKETNVDGDVKDLYNRLIDRLDEAYSRDPTAFALLS